MRDLTEPNDTPARAMLADLTRLDAKPGKPVDGVSGGLASDVPAVNGTGPVRPPRPGFPTPFDHAFAAISAVYDAAMRVMREAPSMPLESPTPWAEDDDAYRRRLDAAHPQNNHWHLSADGLILFGRGYGLPRLRLVRVDAVSLVADDQVVPLASSEPSVESDTHLRNRINAGERGFWWPVPNSCGGSDLDRVAVHAGLLRARLVPEAE